MSHLEWTQALELGIDRLDEQHRQLIRIANELMELIRAEGGHQALAVATDKLSAYVMTHFDDEERYMASIDFPHLEEHRKEHDALSAMVAGFAGKLSRGEALTPEDLKLFLRKWVIGHILTSDMRLKDYRYEAPAGS